MKLHHWYLFIYLIFTLNSMCSNTWFFFCVVSKNQNCEMSLVFCWFPDRSISIRSLIRCGIESMICALGTQNPLSTPSLHSALHLTTSHPPRATLSLGLRFLNLKGPRPLGATALAETNNLEIGCTGVLKHPQMICLYNVQLSDLLNKRGQKGQAARSPLGREVTTYMEKNSPRLFLYSLNHNVYWSFNNKQNWPAEVSQNK